MIHTRTLFITLSIFFIGIPAIKAQDFNSSIGADIVSLYIWRGIDVNNSVNIQPSLSFSLYGFSIGFWGSYSLSNSNSSDDKFELGQEVDTWLEYKFKIENEMNISAIVTDYYFPNAGIRWGNFNNYDDHSGHGAHTIETGLALSGSAKFPITVSGFVNVYNDAGNNTYFQIEYPLSVSEMELNFFAGAAAGSKENPGYYGTEKFNVINAGVKISKEIKITDYYSLPIAVSFIINPKAEKTCVVLCVCL